MNAWAFGTIVLFTLICATFTLIDRRWGRAHDFRMEERFYAPQLPVRRGRIIDVETRNVPLPGDRGTYGGLELRNRVSEYPAGCV